MFRIGTGGSSTSPTNSSANLSIDPDGLPHGGYLHQYECCTYHAAIFDGHGTATLVGKGKQKVHIQYKDILDVGLKETVWNDATIAK